MNRTKAPWRVDIYGDVTANGEDVAHVMPCDGCDADPMQMHD